jgi:hypothetical protein
MMRLSDTPHTMYNVIDRTGYIRYWTTGEERP